VYALSSRPERYARRAGTQGPRARASILALGPGWPLRGLRDDGCGERGDLLQRLIALLHALRIHIYLPAHVAEFLAHLGHAGLRLRGCQTRRV
jgi:hypothetical protein